MQQQIINNAYPGLLDGIIPSLSFADAMTFSQPLFDCELLNSVFKQGTWTRAQMEAVSGMYWGYCVSNGARYPRARVDGCDTAVAAMIDRDPALKSKPPASGIKPCMNRCCTSQAFNQSRLTSTTVASLIIFILHSYVVSDAGVSTFQLLKDFLKSFRWM